jgi:hypothetical protein
MPTDRWFGDRHRTAPAGVPLPRPLPVRSSRRGENSIPLRKLWVASPSPAQFVGEGRGGGAGGRSAIPVEPPKSLPHTQPPPAVLGEVGE